MRNMIHVNLSLALLLGLIVFVSGIETASDNKVSILATTDSMHTVVANPYAKYFICALTRIHYVCIIKNLLYQDTR